MCTAQWFSYIYIHCIYAHYTYIQLYTDVYPFFFGFFCHIGYYRILNSRVPWIIFFFYVLPLDIQGFPGSSNSKESACNVGDLSSIPGLGRSPREGNHYPLQYSGLENSMDRGAWQVTVHGVAKSWTQLSIQHLVYTRFCLAICFTSWYQSWCIY